MDDTPRSPHVNAAVPVRWSVFHEYTEARPKPVNIVSTVTVAATGLRLGMNKELAPGTKLDLDLELRIHGEEKDLRVLAEVLRVQKVSEGPVTRYLTDVEFFDLSEMDRDKIVRFVFEKEQQQHRKGLA